MIETGQGAARLFIKGAPAIFRVVESESRPGEEATRARLNWRLVYRHRHCGTKCVLGGRPLMPDEQSRGARSRENSRGSEAVQKQRSR